jgi:hypothetical protein
MLDIMNNIFGSTDCESVHKNGETYDASYRGHANGSKDYCSSFSLFDKYGLDNCKIELVEVFPCESKKN